MGNLLKFLIFWQFVGAFLTLLVGIGLLLFIRKKTQSNVKGNQPAGFWVRVICLGTDLAVIDVLASLLAYRGSLIASGYITILITISYFFFSWLFFSATPAMMLTRTKILSKESGPLKIWQLLVRLGMFLFLFIGWITILFDKKTKRAFHDIISRTCVVYAEKGVITDSRWVKKIEFTMLGVVAVLLIGLMVRGFGEKLSGYTENEQVTFFDLNKDGMADGLMIDADKDDQNEVFKYDLNNDLVIDFTTFDTDKDGVAESIDINNDGRVDGFDFDKDNILDIKLFKGQFFIWLWKVLFGVWGAGFIFLVIFTILKENKV